MDTRLLFLLLALALRVRLVDSLLVCVGAGASLLQRDGLVLASLFVRGDPVLLAQLGAQVGRLLVLAQLALLVLLGGLEALLVQLERVLLRLLLLAFCARRLVVVVAAGKVVEEGLSA